MPELSTKEFRRLCKGAPSGASPFGAYFFFGEEEYLKASAAAALRDALFPDPSLLPFGRIKISGEGKTAAEWLEELRCELMALPMFGSAKLVELHSVNYGRLTEAETETLLQALSLTDEGTALLLYATAEEFDPGNLPKRPSKLYKSLLSLLSLQLVHFERETPARLAGWVQKHFAAAGIFCDLPTARAFIDYCSPDMFTLASESEKLSCYLLGHRKNKVTEEDIAFVCRAVTIDGNFAFTGAILDGRVSDSMRLLSGMKRRRERPEIILGGIADCVTGMYNCRTLSDAGMQKREIAGATGIHEYRVGLFLTAAGKYRPSTLRRALDNCFETDLRLKSMGGDRYLPLELLILRLAGAAGVKV